MVCESEYALCHSHQTFAVHVHSSEHWIKSKFIPISLHTVRVVLFLHRGTFLHAFYFISITTYEHTITLCCGAQKNRLIEANYLSNEDTFKTIHCCSTLQQQHIYEYTGSEPWIIICAVWSSVHEAIFLIILSWLKKRVIVLSKVLLY